MILKKEKAFGVASFLFVAGLSLSACTDYVAVVDENYDDWKASVEDVSSSSEEQKSSSSVQNSSSVVESSSSAISSSSEVSSSSVDDGYDASAQTLTDARDGKIYKTTKIDSKIWMAENLNYDYNKGTAKSKCYEDNPDSCAKYGRLYMWSAAMDSAAIFSTSGKGCGYGVLCDTTGVVRGVCPEGWHLPSSSEWSDLKTYAHDDSRTLKASSGWNTNGNGSSGFNAIPVGGAGKNASFWSTYQTGNDLNQSIVLLIVDSNDDSDLVFVYKNDIISWLTFKDDYDAVRCVRDAD